MRGRTRRGVSYFVLAANTEANISAVGATPRPTLANAYFAWYTPPLHITATFSALFKYRVQLFMRVSVPSEPKLLSWCVGMVGNTHSSQAVSLLLTHSLHIIVVGGVFAVRSTAAMEHTHHSNNSAHTYGWFTHWAPAKGSKSNWFDHQTAFSPCVA